MDSRIDEQQEQILAREAEVRHESVESRLEGSNKLDDGAERGPIDPAKAILGFDAKETITSAIRGDVAELTENVMQGAERVLERIGEDLNDIADRAKGAESFQEVNQIIREGVAQLAENAIENLDRAMNVAIGDATELGNTVSDGFDKVKEDPWKANREEGHDLSHLGIDIAETAITSVIDAIPGIPDEVGSAINEHLVEPLMIEPMRAINDSIRRSDDRLNREGFNPNADAPALQEVPDELPKVISPYSDSESNSSKDDFDREENRT